MRTLFLKRLEWRRRKKWCHLTALNSRAKVISYKSLRDPWIIAYFLSLNVLHTKGHLQFNSNVGSWDTIDNANAGCANDVENLDNLIRFPMRKR